MGLAKMERGTLGGREVDVCLCPKCGGWPDLKRECNGDLWYWFCCSDCGFVPGMRMYETGGDALHAWNTGAEAEAGRTRERADTTIRGHSVQTGRHTS